MQRYNVRPNLQLPRKESTITAILHINNAANRLFVSFHLPLRKLHYKSHAVSTNQFIIKEISSETLSILNATYVPPIIDSKTYFN